MPTPQALTINELPNDIVRLFVSQLDIRSLFKFTRTNKAFNHLLDDPYFMTELKNYWGEHPWQASFQFDMPALEKNLQKLNLPISKLASARIYLQLLKHQNKIEAVKTTLEKAEEWEKSEGAAIGIPYAVTMMTATVGGISTGFIYGDNAGIGFFIITAIGMTIISLPVYIGVLKAIKACQTMRINWLQVHYPVLPTDQAKDVNDENNEKTQLIDAYEQRLYQIESPNHSLLFAAKVDNTVSVNNDVANEDIYPFNISAKS